MKLLIIEDDLDTQEYLRERLEEKCFAVDVASTGESGMRNIRDNYYDIILLDYALPQTNGLTLIQEIRALENTIKKHTPIIMISVTNELMNKVTALEYGADDYVSKPFFFAEIFARIQTILRRPPVQTPLSLSMGDLVLDIHTQQVTRDGKIIRLTRKEFNLLEYLMRNQGAVVSRNAISDHVWNADLNPFSNTIEAHILTLRKKINSKNPNQFIQSIPGRGYMIGNTKRL